MIRSRTLHIALVAAACWAVTLPATAQWAEVQRVTPILAVDEIEPVVNFWRALGFEARSPNEQNGKLVFMAFAKDGLAIHYQTVTHIQSTVPEATEMLTGSTSLVYIAVDDLDAIIRALPADTEIVIPRRQTAWGADEIYVREPGGHLIGFAEFGDD